MHTVHDPLGFLFAGDARFTVRSKKTGTRYTYRIAESDGDDPVFFASVLTGADNDRDYQYIGLAKPWGLVSTRKAKISADAPSVRALDWVLRVLQRGGHPDLEIFHEGRCCRCGRALTTPESIERGIGPECAKA